MKKYYLGVDLGGTNIVAGLVDREGNILFKKSVPTGLPKPPETIEKDIYELRISLCRESGVDIDSDVFSVGVGTPGSVDSRRGKVWSNVNFGYENWELRKGLERYFSIPVFIENDANVAVIAEAVAGSTKGYDNIVMITLGTGVGGGAYIDGRIYSGHNYAGLEVGHMVIKAGGRQCNCGRKGCFEKYASAAALTLDTQQAMKKNPDSLMWEICPDIDKVNAKTAFDRMKMGDRAAEETVNSYIKYLSCGIVNLINIFQPRIFCIGGGVSNEKEYLLNLLTPLIDREDFARNAAERCKIVIARFRNDAGIIGAAMLGVNNDR